MDIIICYKSNKYYNYIQEYIRRGRDSVVLRITVCKHSLKSIYSLSSSLYTLVISRYHQLIIVSFITEDQENQAHHNYCLIWLTYLPTDVGIPPTKDVLGQG